MKPVMQLILNVMCKCHSPVNLYYAVHVCSLFLMRELSCPLMNVTSSHGSLNPQFSYKPPCLFDFILTVHNDKLCNKTSEMHFLKFYADNM